MRERQGGIDAAPVNAPQNGPVASARIFFDNNEVNLNGLRQLAQKLPRQGRPYILTCVYGLGAGLAAVAFQVAMNALFRLSLVNLSTKATRCL